LQVRATRAAQNGTHNGARALCIAGLLDLLGKGEVATIDVRTDPARPAHPRLRYVAGSSADPQVVASVFSGRRSGEVCLVILDSDHSRDHVGRELTAFAPRVSGGSYLLVGDP